MLSDEEEERCIECNERLDVDEEYMKGSEFFCEDCKKLGRGKSVSYREELQRYIMEKKKKSKTFDNSDEEELSESEYIRRFAAQNNWDDWSTEGSDPEGGMFKKCTREVIKIVKKDKKNISKLEDSLLKSESEETVESSDDGVIETYSSDEEAFEYEEEFLDHTSDYYSESDFSQSDRRSSNEESDDSDRSFTYTSMDGKTVRVKPLHDRIPEGATREELDDLVLYKPKKEERKTLCFVCDVKIGRKPSVLLDCEHLFHEECIKKWLIIKAVCPQCYQSIRPVIEDAFEEITDFYNQETSNSEYDSYSSRDTEFED